MLLLALITGNAARGAMGQPANAQAGVVNEYKRRIAEKITRFIVVPPDMAGNPEVEVVILLLPGGELLDLRITIRSSSADWDAAVTRAVRRAQPFPLPPDPALLKEFRELILKMRPRE